MQSNHSTEGVGKCQEGRWKNLSYWSGFLLKNQRFESIHYLMGLRQHAFERLLLNHANTPGFLAPGREEFNPGPETRLDRSELLCSKVLLKYKGDRESF